MKPILVGTLVATVLGMTPSIHAAQEENRAAQFEQRVSETKARLNLTDAQIEQITPILETSFEGILAVLEKHGIDLENRDGAGRSLGLRGARRLGSDLDDVRADTLDELEEVLDDDQIDEYKKIQEERKSAMRQRIRDRR